MTPLLQIRDVTAGYTSDIDILRNLSLSVAEGSVTGLIGLNGAGKSTVMKAVFGFLRPRSGDITFGGQAIGGRGPHELAALGLWLIPQNGGLFDQMSVEDNLRLPIETRRAKSGDVTPGEIDERVNDVMRRFPILREKRRQAATRLSGGQRKLLEFGIALVQKPKLCLIDEPSIGLSPKVADEVFDLISELSRSGTSILLVDHNLRKVIEIASYIYVLTLGSVSGEGDSSQFGANLHDQVKEWLGINY
jgi:branched-chain amino acid transport system ATP-binding protein